MFNFFHPKPVVSRRPVAELSVKQSARAAPMPGSLVSRRADTLPADGLDAALNFRVHYRRSEYLQFVFAQLHDRLRTEPRLRGRRQSAEGQVLLKPLERGLITTIVSVLFHYKRWRLGPCDFRIDAQGITRRSRRGALVLPWVEVRAVHRHAVGLLIAKAGGALPLPARCLSAAQQAQLDRWVDAWLEAREPAGNAA